MSDTQENLSAFPAFPPLEWLDKMRIDPGFLQDFKEKALKAKSAYETLQADPAWQKSREARREAYLTKSGRKGV